MTFPFQVDMTPGPGEGREFVMVGPTKLTGLKARVYAAYVDAGATGTYASAIGQKFGIVASNMTTFTRNLQADGLIEPVDTPADAPKTRGAPARYYRALYPITERGRELTKPEREKRLAAELHRVLEADYMRRSGGRPLPSDYCDEDYGKPKK